MKISSRYDWLGTIPDLPEMIKQAVALGKLNTTEVPGPKSNPEIMQLASEAGVANIYKTDEMAWCAVAQTAIALRAGFKVYFTGYNRLRASSFLEFGKPVITPVLGDVLVFKRTGGYHVGMYIGEDKTCYHVAGGNQGNQYSIVRIEKSRLVQARRPDYTRMPAGAKKIILSDTGTISKNEA